MAINGVSGSAQQPMQNVNNIAQDMEQVKAAPKDPVTEQLAAQQLQSQQPQTQQVSQTKTDSDGDNDGSKGYSQDSAPSSSQTLTPPWVGRNFNISG